MWWRATRIRQKIALPFTLLFVLATGATAVISVAVMSADVERRSREQILRTSEIIARSDLIENPMILGMLKQMVDAEVITFDRVGGVIAATTADTPLVDEVRSRLAGAGATEAAAPVVAAFDHRGVRYRVTYRRARGRSGAVIAFVVNTADVVAAWRRVALGIGTLSLLIILVMALLSRRIARSITLPVEQLVEHTRRLAAGDLGRRARIERPDEVRRLAAAIDDMAEQLQALEARVLKSEKLALTGQLAARVAHDIRTPMTSIKVEAQLLSRSADPPSRASLQAILRQVDRIERVVRGLLDLARPAALRLQPGDVHEIVEQALATAKLAFRHHGITVARRYEEGLPPVRLNADGLEQALLNVIQNSIEALPAGGTIEVVTASIENPGVVTIEISDDGAGVEPADVQRVFDPFFTTKRDGVGLGLVNTRSIIERHGGSVALSSAAGAGARTVISLPIAALPEELPVLETTAAADG